MCVLDNMVIFEICISLNFSIDLKSWKPIQTQVEDNNIEEPILISSMEDMIKKLKHSMEQKTNMQTK